VKKRIPRIHRIGSHHRWADVVIYNGTARWVEIAADFSGDAASQVGQILAQIDATLALLGCERSALLEVIIHLADLRSVETLNLQWDAWVPKDHPPVRACVQSGLSPNCHAEFVVHAAAPEEFDMEGIQARF
jgi:enamine deaminase RidA (YjgF/YER057c/UK114 family)